VTALVPAVEIGGTHVDAALVDLAERRVVRDSRRRQALRPDMSAGEFTAAVLHAARQVGAAEGAHWAVAVPGPFDYAFGVALFKGVGKFDALHGTDVGALLRRGLPAASVTFTNDADAFLLGEWAVGAAAGHQRAAAVTFGSGVGSAFLVDGLILPEDAGVMPGGRACYICFRGRPLEDTVSRRAIIAAYARAAGGGEQADVAAIAERARRGEPQAVRVLADAMEAAGLAVAPYLERFDATVLVVGGAMTGSWDLIEEPLRKGLFANNTHFSQHTDLRPSAMVDDATLIGAAVAAGRRRHNTH
jgi:glucokinase